MIEVERAVLSGSTAGGFEILERETFISAVSVMELRIGVALASTPERRRARQQFLQQPLRTSASLPSGVEEAEAAAAVFAQLRRAGQRIGERDLMIAAPALANGHAIATLNRAEFERVPGLEFVDIPGLRNA